MYDKDRALNFAGLKSGLVMTSTDAVECLLDFSKGPEAIVTRVNRQAYIGPVGSEETASYTVLESNRKPMQPSHPPISAQPELITPIIPPLNDRPITNTSSSSSGAKPRAICSFCGKFFNHLGDHNKHRRRHTGERPYPCDLCPRRFAHASNLARHRRLHSGEKPFECTTCSRRFSRKDKLAAHVARRSCCKKLLPKTTT